jgi:cbb3-type cytochrome oxidase subunit 1
MLAKRLLLTAVFFFVLGIGLGITMGATKDFRFTHVHAHINLLGWVSLALIGLIYAVFPRLQESPLASAHYWLHTVGLVVFMGGFAWGSLNGTVPLLPVAGGASAVGLGVLLFAANVALRLPRAVEAAPR